MKSKLFKKLIAGAATLAMLAQLGFALPASAEGEIYSQDYESQTVGQITDTALAKSDAAQDWLEIKKDTDHGNYLSFDRSSAAIAGTPSNANSRGAYSNFTADVSEKDSYVIEFDAALTPGNNQNSEIAIKTTSFAYSGNNINNGAGSGYLFKMATSYNDELSTDGTWTINNIGSAQVKVTPGTWYHYKLIIDQTYALTSVTITDSDNKSVADKVIVGIDGASTDVTGLYMLAGRYNPVLNFDNITVRDTTSDDEFGTLPDETINSLSFASSSSEGTVLPEKVTPTTEDGATDSYYIDLTATGTLGSNIFTEYPDNYTVDWKVIGLASEDGYINILLDDDETTNLTTLAGDTVTGSKATGARVDVRNGVSNWFAQIEATVNFTDANGDEKSLTTTKNFVVLAAAENASRIFPDAGYPEAANTYVDDLVGYKSAALDIDVRDTILDWTIFGGNGSRYIELAQEEGGDKYLDFSTGTGTGSTVAEINIGNITDEFVIDMVTKFSGATNWGYYNTTPNNGGLQSAFSFDYSGGAITAGTESVSGISDDTWYRLVISCNRSVGTFSVTVIDENGTTLGTAEGDTDDGTVTCKYFASSFGGAANTHRYIKSCKIYYPTVGSMTVNASSETVSVPIAPEATDNPESSTDMETSSVRIMTQTTDPTSDELVYDSDNKKLYINMDNTQITSGTLIKATYDENGIVSKISDPVSVTFSNGAGSVENISIGASEYVFVWDSLSGMTPLTAKTKGSDITELYDPTEPVVVDLTANLTSTEGFPMSSEVSWEIDTDDEAIVLEPTGAQSATLTVSAGAPAGPVAVTARCGSAGTEEIITLTTTGNSITFEKSTSSITLPFQGNDAVSATFEAYTVNRDGDKTDYAVDDDGNPTTTPATITYTVLDKTMNDITASMPTGVTFDTATGVLTVTDAAKPQAIYIKATNNDVTPLSRTVKVNIHGLSFAFGTNAPADDSYTQVTADSYSDKVGYGFADASLVTAESADVKGSADYRFKVKVPNGNYAVTVSTTSASMLSEVVESVSATTGITKTGANFNVAVCDGVLDLTFLADSTVSSISITQAEAKTKLAKPAIYAIGDSTTNNTGSGAKSWGNCVNSDAVPLPTTFSSFSNNGMAGRDSVNFYNQGRVETVLLSVCPGDYVTVNMGINSKETNESSSYYTLLDEYYINGIIQRGGIPVIVTATPIGFSDKSYPYDANTDKFTVHRGTGAHNGDLRKIAQKYDLNIIELGYYFDQYFNNEIEIDGQKISAEATAGNTTVLDLVKSWYVDHNHYYEPLGNKIANYILDCLDQIAGGSTDFNQAKDTHINEQ